MINNKTYLIISILLPVLFLVPWLMSWNVIGEGVNAGNAEFLPKVLYPYTTWYPGPPEAQAINTNLKTLVITFARVILFVFPLTVINLFIAIFWSIKRIKMNKNSKSNHGINTDA